MYKTLDARNFSGVDLGSSATFGNVATLSNFDIKLDDMERSGQSYFWGFITKMPNTQAYGTDLTSSQNSLGVFYHVPYDYRDDATDRYIQMFSDGTVRVLVPTTDAWTQIDSSINAYLQMSFETYKDAVYMCNGRDPIAKWKVSWGTSVAPSHLKDKGATAEALTMGGEEMHFELGSPLVTVYTNDLTSQLQAGDWIRESSSGNWYEIKSITYSTNTVIILEQSFAETSSDAAAPQKAANTTMRARFLLVWQDRMFYAAGDSTSVPIVGEATIATEIGDSTSQFDITRPATPYLNTSRYTWDGTGTDPGITTTIPGVGNTVALYGQNFAAGNQGDFVVTASGTNYFEVENGSGSAEANKTIGTGFIAYTESPLP